MIGFLLMSLTIFPLLELSDSSTRMLEVNEWTAAKLKKLMYEVPVGEFVLIQEVFSPDFSRALLATPAYITGQPQSSLKFWSVTLI
jgi:hypothetical protein